MHKLEIIASRFFWRTNIWKSISDYANGKRWNKQWAIRSSAESLSNINSSTNEISSLLTYHGKPSPLIAIIFFTAASHLHKLCDKNKFPNTIHSEFPSHKLVGLTLHCSSTWMNNQHYDIYIKHALKLFHFFKHYYIRLSLQISENVMGQVPYSGIHDNSQCQPFYSEVGMRGGRVDKRWIHQFIQFIEFGSTYTRQPDDSWLKLFP